MPIYNEGASDYPDVRKSFLSGLYIVITLLYYNAGVTK